MFFRIVQQEGISALFKGIVPSLLRELSYSSIRLGAYEPLRNYIMTKDELKNSDAPFWKKFVAGAMAGAVGSGIANPVDLIKVRQQACVDWSHASTGKMFIAIYKIEGIKGLFRGVVPTMQRAALLTATQLGTYDHVKHLLRNNLGLLKEGALLHFCSGSIAGFAVAFTTSPVDTIRTRVMNQPVDSLGRPRLYEGSVDCLIKTIRNEGWFAIYKGFLAQVSFYNL